MYPFSNHILVPTTTFTPAHFIFGLICIKFLFIFFIGYILKFDWQAHPPCTIEILSSSLKKVYPQY